MITVDIKISYFISQPKLSNYNEDNNLLNATHSLFWGSDNTDDINTDDKSSAKINTDDKTRIPMTNAIFDVASRRRKIWVFCIVSQIFSLDFHEFKWHFFDPVPMTSRINTDDNNTDDKICGKINTDDVMAVIGINTDDE